MSTAIEKPISVFTFASLKDVKGRSWRVSAEIQSSSYECLLYCHVNADAAAGNFETAIGGVLACDSAFVKGVNEVLAKVGYHGPSLGRAELGMQEPGLVVLEPSNEFAEYAHATFGWVYEEGMDEWRLKTAIRDFNVSFAQIRYLQLAAADGSLWQIHMSHVLCAFEAHTRDTFAAETSAPSDFNKEMLSLFRNPALHGNIGLLSDWLKLNATKVWPQLAQFAQEVRKPRVDLMLQAVTAGNFSFVLSRG